MEYVEDSLTVSYILETLRELSQTPGKIYYYGKNSIDYSFNFQEKCTLEEIGKFEKSIGHPLHDDYKQFLRETNGLYLSTLAVSYLPGIDFILHIREVFDMYPKNLIVVALLYDGDAHALLDLEASANKCMYIQDPIHMDEPMKKLNCSFTEFLHRFVSSYGVL